MKQDIVLFCLPAFTSGTALAADSLATGKATSDEASGFELRVPAPPH